MLFSGCAADGEAAASGAAAGTAGGEAAAGAGGGGQLGLEAEVVSVVDGDTVRVSVAGEVISVRVLGIDTPEKSGGPRPGECYGLEATRLAEDLLPVGTTVFLTRDIESRDAYGRLLAYIHREDGLFFNLEMLKAGAAVPLFFAPNDSMEPLFREAGDKARKDWIGLWRLCGQPDLVISD